MREIILDLETTGLKVEEGHRVIEIGAVEIIDKLKTGNVFHKFLNPERSVSPGAFNVHGISNEFLADKPKFSEIVNDFLAFIGTDNLVIHNASFDIKFINAELFRLGIKEVEYARAIDTLMIARRKFPGSPASLDFLCKRFNISTKMRQEKGHGALLDAELLYKVYICLTEGLQAELKFKKATTGSSSTECTTPKPVTPKRTFNYEEDNIAHEEFLKSITDKALG